MIILEGFLLKKNLHSTFQIAAVFIGTIVGAGLASGKEITQFFTSYGYKSFLGIILCGIMYIFVANIIAIISLKFNISSYKELIDIVSPGVLGKVTDIITGFFLLSSSAIILAGSGALLNQYFGLSKWVGITLMCILSLITLWGDTEGLISINSFIVPCLITVIVTIFTLYVLFYKDGMTMSNMKNISVEKNHWLISSMLYAGFNLLCSSGVIVPLSNEIKDKKALTFGITLGAMGLTLLSFFINMMLMLNKPYIYKYEIPLLYISNRFGRSIQVALLIIIWMEMFSTEVSDIYSISKTIEKSFNLSYKKSIFLILAIAIPISQVGFSNLITILYPSFGVISLIFISQCIYFYYFKLKNK